MQIFSIGIVVMLLISPFKNLAGMNEGASLFSSSRLGLLSVYSFIHLFLELVAFAQFAPSTAKNPKAFTTLILQKLVYVACNVLTLAVGLWKCRSMGLLPTGTGDWLAFETRGIVSTFMARSLPRSTRPRRRKYPYSKSCTSGNNIDTKNQAKTRATERTRAHPRIVLS